MFIGRPARGVERDGFCVPCGVCMGCRLDHAQSWAIRCMHEAALWRSSYFVTFTYEDAQLPPFGSLVKRDLQLFMKRLRKAVPGDREGPDGRRPIRFFACGEYGEKTMRPHYHALLFNVRFPDLVRSSSETFRSAQLQELWPMGHHEIGQVTPASAAYVAGYSVKKVRRRSWNQEEIDARYGVVDPETGEFVVREAEFTLCSRRPGIGRFWLDRFSSDLKHGFVRHDGRERSIPRYYRKALAAAEPEFADLVAYQAWLRAKSIAPEERSRERLEVREEVKVRNRFFHSGGSL